MYVAVGIGGIDGFDWFWLALGLVIDIASYSATAYSNKDQIPGYTATPEVAE